MICNHLHANGRQLYVFVRNDSNSVKLSLAKNTTSGNVWTLLAGFIECLILVYMLVPTECFDFVYKLW